MSEIDIDANIPLLLRNCIWHDYELISSHITFNNVFHMYKLEILGIAKYFIFRMKISYTKK